MKFEENGLRVDHHCVAQFAEGFVFDLPYTFAGQADAFTERDREVLRGRAVVEILEEPVKTPTGERWLHTRKIPVFASSGEARYLLGISQDITERREAQTALQRAHEELERRRLQKEKESA